LQLLKSAWYDEIDSNSFIAEEVAKAHYQHVIFLCTMPKARSKTDERSVSSALSDEQVLDKVFSAPCGPKMKRLYDGDPSERTSRHIDDATLCKHLAYWSKDAAQVERLWLASPLGDCEEVRNNTDHRDRVIKVAMLFGPDVYGTETQRSATKSEAQEVLEIYLTQEKFPSKKEAHALVAEYRLSNDDLEAVWFAAKATHRESRERVKAEKTPAPGTPTEVLAFHHAFASEHPHLLYEYGSDKTYWEYDPTQGIYVEKLKVAVEDLMASELERAGFLKYATSTTIRNRLSSYRGTYLGRAKTLNDFNSDSNSIPAANGILNTAARTFAPFSPEYLFLSKTAVTYDPAATCPRWEKYLLDALEGDIEQIRLLQQFAGYILSSDMSQQRLLVLKGSPGTGKSTFATLIVHLIGTDNVSYLSAEEFNGPHDTEALVGKRLNWTNEAKPQFTAMNNMIKFIDGAGMHLNRKNRPPMNFTPRRR
jgi:hypothetical protein